MPLGSVRPALYMALGTPLFFGGDDRNGVYRLIDPAGRALSATTHWYVGDGNPATTGTHTYSQGGGNVPTRDSHGPAAIDQASPRRDQSRLLPCVDRRCTTRS